ncbi:hypothetical protein Anapl_10046 [Anas platyrhynchos]|uniref:Uncharacterized protein n=1 Tax=Anas platyrhynchos TaxID=8839 RepID=R0KTJ4_ANAPL|nr:hypothetical protein Anapl_10046 [Anas platyrhynchos]
MGMYNQGQKMLNDTPKVTSGSQEQGVCQVKQTSPYSPGTAHDYSESSLSISDSHCNGVTAVVQVNSSKQMAAFSIE